MKSHTTVLSTWHFTIKNPTLLYSLVTLSNMSHLETLPQGRMRMSSSTLHRLSGALLPCRNQRCTALDNAHAANIAICSPREAETSCLADPNPPAENHRNTRRNEMEKKYLETSTSGFIGNFESTEITKGN